jgi:hypothetical protein
MLVTPYVQSACNSMEIATLSSHRPMIQITRGWHMTECQTDRPTPVHSRAEYIIIVSKRYRRLLLFQEEGIRIYRKVPIRVFHGTETYVGLRFDYS